MIFVDFLELPKIDLDGRIIPVPEDVKKLVAIPARSKKQQKYVLLAVTQSKFILFNDQGKRKATANHQNFQRKLHCVWDSSGEVLYSTSGRFTVTSWNFGFGLNSINMGVEIGKSYLRANYFDEKIIESSKFEVIGLSVNNYRQLAILGSG